MNAPQRPTAFVPRPATTHVRVLTDTIPTVPQRRTVNVRSLAPWRFLLAVVAILLAIPCGIAAAAPVWNGADFAVLICLAIFVAAFTIRSKESR